MNVTSMFASKSRMIKQKSRNIKNRLLAKFKFLRMFKIFSFIPKTISRIGKGGIRIVKNGVGWVKRTIFRK